MKGLFLKKLIEGAKNGFPLVSSIKQIIKGEKKVTDTSFIVEIVTVALIAAFVFGKITIEDLKYLVSLLAF